MADAIWDLDPHTGAKHSIVRRYLQAFFPKLSWARRVVFVDGFAGPGVYSGGEPGSPIIALDAAVEHRHDMSECEFVYLFIESDEARLESLRGIIDGRDDPPNITISLRHGAFEDHMSDVLDSLDGGQMAPAFVMVDPFGVKGLPLSLLERIAESDRSELLVSVMYESMSRFISTPEFEPHLDSLFGTPAWRDAISMDPRLKKMFLRELYSAQLRAIGMPYVRSFELRDEGNRTEYFLVFGTHHLDGLRAMKDAMWKVDAAGGYEFSDFTASGQQQTLFASEPDYDQLEALIRERFADDDSVDTTEIDRYILVETPFRETHRTPIFRRLQRDEAIEVERPAGKTRAYWGAGTNIRFL